MNNNMTFTGQGLAHPEASQERIINKDFASLIPVMSGRVSQYGFDQLTPERVEINVVWGSDMGNTLTAGMANRLGVSHA
ncbi:TPA: hypothetical protein ACTYZ0_003588 [Citrobacter werkmanii]